MNRHEGVSCNCCVKRNFRGKRYKCLLCYDYDLCANCYEAGATSAIHTTEHPVQCLLTRADFELYYGGEILTSLDLPQCFTCPLCNKMGFTENTLQEHVAAEHSNSSIDVVCPICASLPDVDPTLRTDDFAGHLALEHRSNPNDLISFLDEAQSTRQDVRRIPHTSRGVAGTRSRRSNMQFNSSGILSYLTTSRGNVDPITELLSQLSGVRRSTTNTSVSGTNNQSQLHQLQMQLQLERQQINVARQHLDRLPRRQLETTTTISGRSTQTHSVLQRVPPISSSAQSATIRGQNVSLQNSQFLLFKIISKSSFEPENDEQHTERGMFVQQLLLSSLTQASGQFVKKLKEVDPSKMFGKCKSFKDSEKKNVS